jgi:hypothetical protein
MARKSKTRRSHLGRSQVAQVVTALAPSEVWDRQLAVRKDSIAIQQRVFGFVSEAGVGLVSASLSPNSGGTLGSLGQRLFVLSTCYSRYRIKRALAVMRGGTSSNGAVFGFLDDPDGAFIPINATAIADFRCSRIVSSDATDRASLELEWKPVDPKKWYYTNFTGSAAGDIRSAVPANFYAFALSGVTNLTFDLYVEVVFEGSSPPTTSG